MATLQVRLLGELGVEFDGAAITLPTSRRACALLAWLALQPGPHSRSRLASLLWPDVLDASARASLRSALWALRAAFGPTAGEYLHAGRDHVELAGNGLVVDVRELERLLAAGCPQEAVALHRGDLLAQFDADWVLDARDEFRDRLCGAYAALAVAAEGDGHLTMARDWAAKRMAAAPLDEQAARQLIRLLVAVGDQAGAAATYQRFAARLGAELGVSPAAETTRLVSSLRERSPGPAVPAAPAAGAGNGVRNGAGRLVGRDGEVRALLRHWRASSAGSGTAVAVTGDGGMGKTTLVREILDVAAADGALTATAAAGGPGATAPFALWSELLDDLIAQSGPLPQPAPHGDGDWDTLLAAIRTGARAPATEPRLDRIRFFEATVAVLSWAARSQPLALALEDLHAADPSSLELVAYVGRRITRQPVLLVLTRRRLPPRPELDAVLAALRARGTLAAEFDLGPLPAAALDKLVRLTAQVPAPHRERIVRLAAGNPLLAVETARYVAQDGDPAAGLAGATRQAVARLSPAARLFTELAAVTGRDLDRAEVASLPLLDNPPRAAAEALGSGLLHTRAERTGFRHQLLCDAVYQDLPDPVRARLHETLATWLRERDPRGSAVRPSPARSAAEIARHFRLAGQADLAADQLVRAAAAARTVAALPEAAAYLTEAAPLAGDAGAGPDPELLIELADVQAWRGMLPESNEAFDRALELIAADDHDALAAAWLRRGHWLRGGICHPRESLRSYRAALDCLERGGGTDPLILTESLAGMAWAQAVAGDAGEAHDLLVKAEGLLNEVAETSTARASRLSHDIDMARAHALPLVVPTGLLRPCVYTHSARTALLRLLGRLGEAHVACGAAAAAAERIGLPELEGLVHHDLGLLAIAAGEYKTAASELGLALDLGAPVSRPLARLLRAESLARDGRPDNAEHELRAVALERVSPADLPDILVARMSHVQGLIALQRGNLPLAARRLREAESGWLRRSRLDDAEHDSESGQNYVAALIDLGRPPVAALIEPARELSALRADIATAGGPDA